MKHNPNYPLRVTSNQPTYYPDFPLDQVEVIANSMEHLAKRLRQGAVELDLAQALLLDMARLLGTIKK